MPAKITFFPVDNGDMTLIELENGKTILIDVSIRVAADDPDDPTRDVAKDLRKRLKRDAKGRLYVDAYLLSHPDRDHCTGLDRHFHLGPSETLSGDKILVREIWSSPLIFRRASRNHPLCDDAAKFNTEAKRRVARYREIGAAVGDGDRILILGRDENGKTNDLMAIVVEVDSFIPHLNGLIEPGMSARLLGPLPKSDDEAEEETLSKNHSSVILQFTLLADGGSARFLTAGDAEVAIWERQWNRHRLRPHWLAYDLLLSPHHCSWHTLSYDSWSEMGEDAQVIQNARNALAQAGSGAHIIASSKLIRDDDDDPPCIRARREYNAILEPVTGRFLCTAEYPNERRPAPMEFEIDRNGLSLKSASLESPAIITGAIGGQPLPHG